MGCFSSKPVPEPARPAQTPVQASSSAKSPEKRESPSSNGPSPVVGSPPKERVEVLENPAVQTAPEVVVPVTKSAVPEVLPPTRSEYVVQKPDAPHAPDERPDTHPGELIPEETQSRSASNPEPVVSTEDQVKVPEDATVGEGWRNTAGQVKSSDEVGEQVILLEEVSAVATDASPMATEDDSKVLDKTTSKETQELTADVPVSVAEDIAVVDVADVVRPIHSLAEVDAQPQEVPPDGSDARQEAVEDNSKLTERSIPDVTQELSVNTEVEVAEDTTGEIEVDPDFTVHSSEERDVEVTEPQPRDSSVYSDSQWQITSDARSETTDQTDDTLEPRSPVVPYEPKVAAVQVVDGVKSGDDVSDPVMQFRDVPSKSTNPPQITEEEDFKILDDLTPENTPELSPDKVSEDVVEAVDVVKPSDETVGVDAQPQEAPVDGSDEQQVAEEESFKTPNQPIPEETQELSPDAQVKIAEDVAGDVDLGTIGFVQASDEPAVVTQEITSKIPDLQSMTDEDGSKAIDQTVPDETREPPSPIVPYQSEVIVGEVLVDAVDVVKPSDEHEAVDALPQDTPTDGSDALQATDEDSSKVRDKSIHDDTHESSPAVQVNVEEDVAGEVDAETAGVVQPSDELVAVNQEIPSKNPDSQPITNDDDSKATDQIAPEDTEELPSPIVPYQPEVTVGKSLVDSMDVVKPSDEPEAVDAQPQETPATGSAAQQVTEDFKVQDKSIPDETRESFPAVQLKVEDAVREVDVAIADVVQPTDEPAAVTPEIPSENPDLQSTDEDGSKTDQMVPEDTQEPTSAVVPSQPEIRLPEDATLGALVDVADAIKPREESEDAVAPLGEVTGENADGQQKADGDGDKVADGSTLTEIQEPFTDTEVEMSGDLLGEAVVVSAEALKPIEEPEAPQTSDEPISSEIASSHQSNDLKVNLPAEVEAVFDGPVEPVLVVSAEAIEPDSPQSAPAAPLEEVSAETSGPLEVTEVVSLKISDDPIPHGTQESPFISSPSDPKDVPQVEPLAEGQADSVKMGPAIATDLGESPEEAEAVQSSPAVQSGDVSEEHSSAMQGMHEDRDKTVEQSILKVIQEPLASAIPLHSEDVSSAGEQPNAPEHSTKEAPAVADAVKSDEEQELVQSSIGAEKDSATEPIVADGVVERVEKSEVILPSPVVQLKEVSEEIVDPRQVIDRDGLEVLERSITKPQESSSSIASPQLENVMPTESQVALRLDPVGLPKAIEQLAPEMTSEAPLAAAPSQQDNVLPKEGQIEASKDSTAEPMVANVAVERVGKSEVTPSSPAAQPTEVPVDMVDPRKEADKDSHEVLEQSTPKPQEPSSSIANPQLENVTQTESQVEVQADRAGQGVIIVAEVGKSIESEKPQPPPPAPVVEVPTKVFDLSQHTDKDGSKVPDQSIAQMPQSHPSLPASSHIPPPHINDKPSTENQVDLSDDPVMPNIVTLDETVRPIKSLKVQPTPPAPVIAASSEVPGRNSVLNSRSSSPAPQGDAVGSKMAQLPLHAPVPKVAKGFNPSWSPVTSPSSTPPPPQHLSNVSLPNSTLGGVAPVEHPDPFQRTDNDFIRILDESIPKKDSKQAKEFQDIVGTIIVLQDPLPLATLAKLLRLPEKKIQPLLKKLHGVNILSAEPKDQNPIAVYPSLSDFLTSRKRCSDRLLINPGAKHGQLTTLCLTQMASLLPKGENYAEASLPPNLRYCCLYWTSHLGKAPRMDAKLCSTVSSFCKVQLSKWLVAVRVLGKLDVATKSLAEAETYLTVQNPKDIKALLNIVRGGQQKVQSWQASGAQSNAQKILPSQPHVRPDRPTSPAEDSDDENYDD